MGQQLHIRYKRQRRSKWIERKKMEAKAAKPKANPPKAENSPKPAETQAGN